MGKIKKTAAKSKAAIYLGKNEYHLRFVQEARRSNMSGFHEPAPKARLRKVRKLNKQIAKDAQRGIF